MRSIAVARWFRARPHLRLVRTRHEAPETNGVIERWFESLKDERLYRHDITGALRAEGRLIRTGSRIALAEADLSDADGNLYAHATSGGLPWSSHPGSWQRLG